MPPLPVGNHHAAATSHPFSKTLVTRCIHPPFFLFPHLFQSYQDPGYTDIHAELLYLKEEQRRLEERRLALQERALAQLEAATEALRLAEHAVREEEEEEQQQQQQQVTLNESLMLSCSQDDGPTNIASVHFSDGSS